MNRLITDIINSVFHAPNHNFSIELPNTLIDDKEQFLDVLQYNLDFLYLNTNVDDVVTFYDNIDDCFDDNRDYSSDENINYDTITHNIGYGNYTC